MNLSTKQLLALSDQLTSIMEKEEKFWELERPWLNDPYYPKPHIEVHKPEWEAEKARLKRQRDLIHTEMEKLTRVEPSQQSLLEDGTPKALTVSEPAEEGVVIEEGDDLIRAAETIFGAKAQPMSEEDKRTFAIAQSKNALIWTVVNGHVNVLAEKAHVPEVAVSSKGAEILKMFENRRKGA